MVTISILLFYTITISTLLFYTTMWTINSENERCDTVALKNTIKTHNMQMISKYLHKSYNLLYITVYSNFMFKCIHIQLNVIVFKKSNIYFLSFWDNK